MAYIPANPNYAVVNCKIGDLNMTPIPPDSLESFTYERDTSTGGNKFTIVVHDETAIVMESYLAEAMAKAKASQSYNYDDDLSVLDELGNVDLEDYVDDGEESEESENEETKDDEEKDKEYKEDKEEDTPAKASLMSLGFNDDIPLFLDEINTNLIGSNQKTTKKTKVKNIARGQEKNDPESTSLYSSDLVGSEEFLNNSMSNFTETISASSLRELIRPSRTYSSATVNKKFSDDNETPLRSGQFEDTTSISGGTGVTTTNISNMRITEGSPVKPNVIDDSKLHYADPKTGLRIFLGKSVPEDVWIGEGAIDEFTNGFDPSGVID